VKANLLSLVTVVQAGDWLDYATDPLGYKLLLRRRSLVTCSRAHFDQKCVEQVMRLGTQQALDLWPVDEPGR